MICKVIPVKPQKNSIKKGVRECLSYVMNREKAAGDYEENIRMPDFKENICPILDYTTNEEKTKKIYVSGYLCNPSTAAEEFYLTKSINLAKKGKTIEDDTGNQAYHIIQSFPDDLDISDAEVHQCAIDLVKKLGKYQAVIASHVNPVVDEDGIEHGKAKHSHIVINSHMNPEFVDPNNIDLIKYPNSRESYSILQQLNDEVAIEHGLPIIEDPFSRSGYSWIESKEANEGRSWKQRVKEDINEAMNASRSWDEYLKFMKKIGYTIHEGKHETYTTPHAQKVRGSTLGNEYTKEYINGYWNFRSNLQNQLNFELKRNEGTIPYSKLKGLMEDTDCQYFIKIPRIHANTGENYALFYPLAEARDEKTVRTFINESDIYPVYRGKNELLGAVSGDVAVAALTGSRYVTYEEQKANEAEENEKVKKDDIKMVLERERAMVYTRKGWTSSKTGKPYSIGLYDDDGNKRTLLEQLLILAIVVITREVPEYLLTEREKEQVNSTVIIIDDLPKKAQTFIEALKTAREEDIETVSELEERLKETGMHISQTKRELAGVSRSRAKMDTLNQFVEDFENAEGHDINIESKESAVIHRFKIYTNEDIEDFKTRYRSIVRRENALNIELHNLNEKYRKLKKLEYHVNMAQDKDFCYGKDKTREKELDE